MDRRLPGGLTSTVAVRSCSIGRNRLYGQNVLLPWPGNGDKPREVREPAAWALTGCHTGYG
jgi:hypothetical protein